MSKRRRRFRPPSLANLSRAHEEGLFEDPVRSRLLHSAQADDPWAAALHFVGSQLENADLRSVLAEYASGELRTGDFQQAVRVYRSRVDADPARSALLRAATSGDPAVAAMKFVAADVDNTDLKSLLAEYASGELRADDFQEAVRVYRRRVSADKFRRALVRAATSGDPAAAAMKLVASGIDNRDLKSLLSEEVAGSLRPDDLKVVARIYRKQLTADPVRRALLRAVTAPDPAGVAFKFVYSQIDNRDLRLLLSDHAAEELRSDDLKQAMRIYRNPLSSDRSRTELLRAAVSADPTKAAFQHIRNQVDNRDLRLLLSDYLDGALRTDDLRQAMRVYRKRVTNDDTRLELLRAATAADPAAAAFQRVKTGIDNADLRSVLSKHAAGELRSDDFHFLMRLYHERAYAEDLLATQATADFLEDPDFVRAYNAGARISAWGHDIRWRVYTLLNCARRAMAIDGHFVECGVDRGGTALCVIEGLGAQNFADRDFYLFDTFDGLVDEQQTETERQFRARSTGRFPDVFEEVRGRFGGYDFVKLVRGTVPETLERFEPAPVAYLHIDMNVATPERKAFEFFWPLLVPGAPVIFDDYGFPYHTDQRDQLDDAAKALGTEIMMLPTGQGLCWKT